MANSSVKSMTVGTKKWLQNGSLFFGCLLLSEFLIWHAAFNCDLSSEWTPPLKAERRFPHPSACKCEIICNKIEAAAKVGGCTLFPHTLQEQKAAMTSEDAAESAKRFHAPPKAEKLTKGAEHIWNAI